MVWQRSGTVSVQNGSTTVTGTGIDFAASSRVGDSFVGPDGATYEVANVASGTVISILPPYKGPTASGAAYAIMPVQGYDKMLSDAFNNLNNQFGPKLAALGTTGNYDILPVTKGGTGRTSVGTSISADFVTSSSDITAGRVLTVGHSGWNGGGGIAQASNVDANSLTVSGVYIFLSGGNPNTPTNIGYMIVYTHPAAGYCRQVFKGFNSNDYFERYQSGGSWGDWDRVYGSSSVLLDPQSAGGLMSMATVSGYTVFKYANGQMCILGSAPTTANLPANNTNSIEVTVPSGLVANTGLARPTASVRASAANDHYGIISCDMSSATSVNILLRSGPTAQSYNPRVCVWGQWK